MVGLNQSLSFLFIGVFNALNNQSTSIVSYVGVCIVLCLRKKNYLNRIFNNKFVLSSAPSFGIKHMINLGTGQEQMQQVRASIVSCRYQTRPRWLEFSRDTGANT